MCESYSRNYHKVLLHCAFKNGHWEGGVDTIVTFCLHLCGVLCRQLYHKVVRQPPPIFDFVGGRWGEKEKELCLSSCVGCVPIHFKGFNGISLRMVFYIESLLKMASSKICLQLI